MNASLSLSDKIRLLGDGAERRGDLFRRAAARAGISYSQAKRIFYGETDDPKSSVRERIDHALQDLNQKAANNAREQADKTADVTQLVEHAMEVDADLRSEIVALVLRKLTGRRAEDRPMD